MKKYDLAFIFCANKKEPVLKWLHRECLLRKMKFLWINEHNAHSVLHDIEHKKMRISYLVDNESNYYNPEDIYLKICYAVKDDGGKVLEDPDTSRMWADKSVTHFDFLEANLPVPYTVVVRNWRPDNFILTRDQLKKLGSPFIIKPARGFGQRGVVKDGVYDINKIAQARHFSRGDNFLLQEKIEPAPVDGEIGWFRIYYLFGEIIPCFWNPVNGHYRHIDLKTMQKYRLWPLIDLVHKIEDVVRMHFFSTEIALSVKGRSRRYVIIDYVNDQCELCVRPARIGGPVPEVVHHIAEVFVRHAWMQKVGKKPILHHSIMLAHHRRKNEEKK